jgi:hypothetical protein
MASFLLSRTILLSFASLHPVISKCGYVLVSQVKFFTEVVLLSLNIYENSL